MFQSAFDGRLIRLSLNDYIYVLALLRTNNMILRLSIQKKKSLLYDDGYNTWLFASAAIRCQNNDIGIDINLLFIEPTDGIISKMYVKTDFRPGDIMPGAN